VAAHAEIPTWPSAPGSVFAAYRAQAGACVEPVSLSEATLHDLRGALEQLVLDADAGGVLLSGLGIDAEDPPTSDHVTDLRIVPTPADHPLHGTHFTLAATPTFTALVVAQRLSPEVRPPQLATLWTFDPDLIDPVARVLVAALDDVDAEAAGALRTGLRRHPPRPPAPGVQPTFTNAVFTALEAGRQRWRHQAEDLQQLHDRVEHAEQQAGHQERLAATGTVAASVAHDISSPLSTITMAIALLRQAGHDDQRPALLETIERAAMRAGRISQDLLAYAGDHTLRRHHLDLGAWLLDWIDGDATTSSSIEIPDHPVMIDADPHRLEQVLGNLLDNAMQAPGRGSPVRIRLHTDDGRATVEISDDGAGVPGDLLDTIFEPFVSSKKPGEGTGLGLAIVAALVERHGGEVELADTGPGGTTFAVHLPLADEAALEAGDPRTDVPDTAGLGVDGSAAGARRL
jgi:signal transduction histidine kinase